MTPAEVFRATVSVDQAGERVDRLAAQLMTDVTRAAIQRWIVDQRVFLNGVACRAKDRVQVGMILEVHPDLPPPTAARPEPEVVVDVRFEDEHLLVVHKPAGLVVHPGRGHRSGTLVNGLLARPGFERVGSDPRDPEGYLRPGIVHRIDKDTSGLLVIAKTERGREGLKNQLSSHTMERAYEAISISVPRPGVVRTLYGRDPRSRLRFSSLVKQGKQAVTHLELIETLASGRAAHVRCRLETGRTHQIRVHLSQQLKAPLLADRLYGGMTGPPDIMELAQRLGRQALHAKLLGFCHPVTGIHHRFEAELPLDMNQALDGLRALSTKLP